MRFRVLALVFMMALRVDADIVQDYHLRLVAPTGTTKGDFGIAVATWRNLVFVGSPSWDRLSGAVYVYDGTNGSLVKTLRPDTSSEPSGFG